VLFRAESMVISHFHDMFFMFVYSSAQALQSLDELMETAKPLLEGFFDI